MDYEKKYNEALERARALRREAIEKDYVEDYVKDYETIFPELRESEDERIRKAIVNLFEVASEAYLIEATGFKKEQFLSYLEKQKEQSHDGKKWIYEDDYHKDMERSFNDGKDEVLENPEKYGLQKEQKPAEWSEVELEFRGEKVTVKRPFYRDNKGRGYSTAELDEDVAWNALRAWCEKKGISLYDLYPKAEWSEEDEKMIWDIVDVLEADNVENKRKYPYALSLHERYKKMVDWLKSLRPSWKPSEEQMEALAWYSGNCNIPPTGDKAIKSLYNDLKKL